MNKYTVVIEETIANEVEIVAENDDEALKIAEDKYKSGDIVLCPGELQSCRMAVVPLSDDINEWRTI